MTRDGKITAQVWITNTGKTRGTDTVQLYIRDVAASVVRPVLELKGFEKVTLEPGEKRKISFTITDEMLAFYREDGTCASENGTFRVWISDSSVVDKYAEFELN